MKKSITRLIALLLVLVMCLGVLPVTAMAENGADYDETQESEASLEDKGEEQDERGDLIPAQSGEDTDPALLEEVETEVEHEVETEPDSSLSIEIEESGASQTYAASEYEGYTCTIENDSATVTLSDSIHDGNQAIRIAVGGNEFDPLLDIAVTGLAATEAPAWLQSESLQGQNIIKYRIVHIISTNEAEPVSVSELSEDGKLSFTLKGDGTYVLVRLKGVELDPSINQSSPAFFAELVSGARKNGVDYVWTADNSASGHRFVFRINYRFVLYSDSEPDKIQMIIPERILKDRNGEYADGIELSVPSQEEIENDGPIDDDVFFAWRMETDESGEPTGNIVIYNFKPFETGTRSGSIELAYYTSESTLEYRDYDPDDADPTRSDPFHCVLLLQNKSPIDSDYFPVCIDTTAVVSTVEKGRNDAIWLYDNWMSYWGDAAEFGVSPSDGSKYIMWRIKAEIFATQPYDLTVADVPLTEGLEAVALRWLGESEYLRPDAEGVWKKQNLSGSPVYAYVITRVDESIHKDLISGQEVEKWTVQNKAIITVQPIDEVDSPSSGTDTASFTHEVPLFYDPAGHFDAWKRGDGAYRAYEGTWWKWTSGAEVILNSLNIFTDSYSRYDLDRFGVHNGNQGELETYDGFDYAVWMWGKPYVLTKDWQYHNSQEKNNGYFRDYTIYDQWDFDVKLGHSASDLISIGAGDYRIKKIQFNAIQYDAKLNSAGLDFVWIPFTSDRVIDEDDTQGGIGDVLHIYGKTGAGDWVELLRKDYRSGGSTWVNSEYASLEADGKSIVLKESQDHSKDIILYRTVMKTRHFWTSIGTVPEFELFPSETVLSVVNESDVICLFNDTYADLYSTWEGQTKNVEFDADDNVSNVYYTGNDYRGFKWDEYSEMNIDLEDGDTRTYYRYFHIYDSYRRDYDYARSSVSGSSLAKRITSTSNDSKMARFTISWQVDMSETITSSRGGGMLTENVLQNGGVFYDLLPKGAALDLKSVKVIASNNELDYHLEQISNWRGSGRTMLIVTVLNQGVNYSLSYETTHAWTSIKDYGNEVYNPVAYETGNDSIANGSPDDGSGFERVSENMRSWMRDLDNACGDKNRFLYADSNTSIVAVIALSNGTSKRVKALNDTAFRGLAYVDQSGVYVYRLSYAPDSMVHAKNILFIDNVEDSNPAGRQWQGTLYSTDPEHPEYAVDVTQMKAAGVEPTLYFSDHVVALEKYGDEQTTETYLSELGFQPSEEFFATHTLSDVKAFAVYCGDDFEFKGTSDNPNKPLTLLLYMKSPDYIPDKGNPYPATYNNFALNMRVGVSGETGTWEYIPHTSITPDVIVYTRIMQDIPLQKVSEENETYVISNVKFKLSGKSFYTGKQIELFETTDSNGKLLFEGVERGSYILEEADCPKDWVLKKQPFQILIDGYGRLWISELGVFKSSDGVVQTDPATGVPLMLDGSAAPYDYAYPTERYDPDIFTITNEPRVYTDFSFYKIGKRSGNPIEGVEFRLEGISHYNNAIEMTAVSDSEGLVTFENLEWGTYTLTETRPQEGYRTLPDSVGIRVEVGGNSLVSVFEYDTETGKDKTDGEWITVSQLGDVMIMNPEKHSEIEFYKAEKAGESYRYLPGAKFSLKGSSNDGTAVDLEAVSDENGVVRFSALEEGIYELKELEPPKNILITELGDAVIGGTINYKGDPNTYFVTIFSDGTFSICLKTASGVGSELGKDGENHYVFLNTPLAEGEIEITKKWVDSLTGDAAFNRPYPQLTLMTESAFGSNYYTVKFDAFGGYFPTGGTQYAKRYRADELPTEADADAVPTPLRMNYLFDGWVYKLSGNDELIPFSLSDYGEKASITVYAKWIPYRVWNYSYKSVGDYMGAEQKFTAPVTGEYKLEAWGANGGNAKTSNGFARNGGRGAYTSGTIHLEAGQTIYIYVGGRGSDGVNCPRPTSPRNGVWVKGGWNGGGIAVSDTGWSNDDTSGSGGGATDFRLLKGNSWDSFDSLKSRIMVAGGGGGPVSVSSERLLEVYEPLDGQAEALPKWSLVPGRTFCYKASISADGIYLFSKDPPSGDDRYSPVGDEMISGSFGKGAEGSIYRYNLHSIGGGGGGWYGGCAGSTYYADSYTWIRSYGASATGGTSYISGHDGCYAIDQTSSEGNISHLSTSEFSGYVFHDTTILAGYDIGAAQANPDSSGNGYARITYVVPEDNGTDVAYPEQSLTQVSGSVSSDDEVKSISSMEKTDAEGNPTPGYWEKIADDTWVYHFRVIDPSQDYIVFENSGLVYSAYNYHYESDEMTPGYVELPGEIFTATITNRLPTGSLIITKHVSGGSTEQKFRFTVNLTDAGNRPVSGVYGGVSFKNGTGVFSLSDGESKMITNIPAGYRFSVDEEPLATYTKSFTTGAPSGIIEANSAVEISCLNIYSPPEIKPVNITVKKVETGQFETPGVYTIRADFRSLVPNVSYSFVAGDKRESFVADQNGSYNGLLLSMRNGDTVIFEQIPVGAQYKFSEPGGDYTASYSVIDAAGGMNISQSASATVKGADLSTAWETADADEQVTVTFENRLERISDLCITKAVDGLNNGAAFEITLLISELSPGSRFTAVRASDNPFVWTANDNGEIIRTVSLKDNESLVIRGLPIGAKYRVAEADPDGYIPSVQINGTQIEVSRTLIDEGLGGGMGIAEQTIHEGDRISVVITNSSKTGALKISKHLAGNDTNPEELFPFRIMLSYKNKDVETPLTETSSVTVKLNGEIKDATFINGILEVSLGDNDTLLIEGIYEGVDYSVDEIDSGKYELTVEGSKTGKITSRQVSEIIFTNTRITYSIRIAKTDENGHLIKGAALQLLNAKGEVAKEWISDLEPFTLDGLLPGKYMLTELEAPEGYVKADDIRFELDDNGRILINGVEADEIVMIDETVPTPPPPVPEPSQEPSPILFNLVITEEIYSDAPKTDEFTFILELYNPEFELPDSFEVEGTRYPNGGQLFFERNNSGSGTQTKSATFKLGHEEEIKIIGLPEGTLIKIIQIGGDERYETQIDWTPAPSRTADRAIIESDIIVNFENGYTGSEQEPAQDQETHDEEADKEADKEADEEIIEPEIPLDDMPDTGDEHVTVLWIAFLVLSLFGIALILRNKKAT